MPAFVEIITPPAVEPIMLQEAKNFCRVDFNDEDQLITQLIVNARVYGESITKRALAVQTLRAIIEPDHEPTGLLSGPISSYADIPELYAERITARPLSLYGLCLQLPMSPISSITKVEYQLTPFDVPEWQELLETSDSTKNWILDKAVEPARLYIRSILAASRYRVTYTAGYQTLTGTVKEALLSLVSHWFNNRESPVVPDDIERQFGMRRIWQL